ncbi:MAG: hypothetical protein WB683_11020, partial [Candidatus Sulfotelmatobacter sp.]
SQEKAAQLPIASRVGSNPGQVKVRISLARSTFELPKYREKWEVGDAWFDGTFVEPRGLMRKIRLTDVTFRREARLKSVWREMTARNNNCRASGRGRLSSGTHSFMLKACVD